ncbi:alpha/beta-hydrolase [Pluteus cervinus]|uniref:Alpha/beta-hydrolase n=1 Tax=Pluteus cervinus TaxID=181527 RepID=A0ACD3B6A8_9AGAR|nr:alpha/beta-hydrolase [Pluteus cervinus]
MLLSIASLFLAFAHTQVAIGATAVGNSTNPIIDLGYAKYQGFVDPTSGNTQFLGIRYAAAPVGNLRWRAPQTPAKTSGILQANAQPPQCFNAGAGLENVTPFRNPNPFAPARRSEPVGKRDIIPTVSSEDCLHLNVYSPGILDPNANKLPVVVWIHGGGYMAGNASEFNGDDLITDAEGGVVVVIIQYRLGVFGFLPGTQVQEGGDLNAGLLDQHFALQWVHKHITKFGGDPTKVTIWGESAGAGSVLQHIVAQDGKTNPPLFRAGISSSLYLPPQYNFNDPIAEDLYSEVVSLTGCTSATNTLNCLRGLNDGLLQGANVNISESVFFGTFVFVPVVDGTFIVRRPSESLKMGRVNGEAVLAVTNAFEGTLFVNLSTAGFVQSNNYAAQLFPELGNQQIQAAAAQYASVGTPINQAIGIMGESIFICPTYYLLMAFEGRGFKGEFAIPPGEHGQDVAYYFFSQNPNGVPGFSNPVFDKSFAESFLNFAMSLNPNVKVGIADATPHWDVWRNANGVAAVGDGVEMLFNMTAAGAPVIQPITTSSSLLERCNFWESVTAMTAQ